MIIRDKLCKFCTEIYVVTLHMNRFNETVQMRGSNISWFQFEIRKNTPQLSSNTPVIRGSAVSSYKISLFQIRP